MDIFPSRIPVTLSEANSLTKILCDPPTHQGLAPMKSRA